jgi:hypothetical protein
VFGTQYALVTGLLDGAYPQVSFVVELPFPLHLPLSDDLSVVVPMSAMRTGEEQDTVVRVAVGHVNEPGRVSTAPLRYLRARRAALGRDYGRVASVPSRHTRSQEKVTVVRLTTPNVLPDSTPAMGNSEVGVRLFNRCIAGLNRFLDAYVVATEEPAARSVTAEGLGYFAAVELADEDGRPLRFGGFLTLPSATMPDFLHDDMGDEDLLVRLRASMTHEQAHHPMDTVVVWQMRALHYSQRAGDYEMALLALNVSGEVLLDSVWAAQRVDEGADSSLYDGRPQFTATLKRVARDLGEPWRRGSDDVWSVYVADCYDLRNETAHEGRKVDAEQLDAALDAYEGLRQAVERLTLASAQTFPRTALMVHGPVGMKKADALSGAVADELERIGAEGEVAFWLPPDLRVGSGGGVEAETGPQ